ncbi:PcfB family protein [Blautia sp. MSJ-36]|uniref:PcfB family protein n=1 Tax=Blautia sp. MSJ-36 TaxID=2841530 RepID=UPI001C117521|nr:PcfB family protein [Blautia sp. MSJ-36]MBU5448131.1 PcfB family protein [Blautia sp. MSJ-36]MCQ2501565.1 PcfB family protein [Lachnospiraceae bacterium]
MQEEVENRTVNLAISTTRLSGRTIISAFRLWKSHHNNVKAKKAAEQANEDTTPHGKQSIQELIGQNQGVSSIDIQNTNIRDFEKIANKYGVDYAITRDKTVTPPKYMVFFKARDADALTAAFAEYSNQRLKAKDKPSVLKQLGKLKELVASIPSKVRNKSQERDL